MFDDMFSHFDTININNIIIISIIIIVVIIYW